ncbi:hypothetical protein VAE151_560176 [Vibrio aestuarianus]|uniref:Uncharacterized protein n=1 Tax=Vibrio aestuarianus TaxID=28171 RepID=A0ABM9FR79_9VIBR|nr:hypothetical protein VIBAE_A31415 [Vibrio aestuarianus subsp. francensis]CAH8201897.1 hypothetical protein VAE055_380174 [Vibrio aestuarianus]CAH8202103.1 hypothetical protein VAE128_460823 [Vibrio aestuarianus]CAH8202273.1 hypothetical protein VAE130_570820 [Vibrio aestuarianus]CAH8210000.1 hypothetical protein VAE142_890816 [Vibrio aestuarianus]
MSARNLKDGSKKPWLCECYPQGRGGINSVSWQRDKAVQLKKLGMPSR